MTDWLVAQLPQVMQASPLLTAFARGCGEVTETVRDRLDSLEHSIDIDLAEPQLLRYLAAWLGVHLDALPAAAGDEARAAQRRLIRAVAATLGRRGTAFAVDELLQALTGGRVTVHDTGGVWVAGEPVPEQRDVVEVVLDTYGPLTAPQVQAFLADEVPVGCTVRVRLRGERADA